jgi:small ligand-binding sensory domain FIST
MEYLRELYEQLDARERELFQHLHLGVVVNEYQEAFGQGDFLVRNLYSLDRASGALVIMDRVRVGQTVQFHVRDPDFADEELRTLLRAHKAAHPAGSAAGLLFTCNGRGSRMFSVPDHDAAVLAEELGPVPVAGLFAAGELGPVGGRNFLHGFTASVALFGE